jgi:hypothetical protein
MERRVQMSSLVREKFRRIRYNVKHSPCSKHRFFLMGLESTAGNKLEKTVCKGAPLSTLAKVCGHTALGVVHVDVTRFVAPGHDAPFSLPQPVAFADGTIVHADVLQLLSGGGVEDDTRWQWDGQRVTSVFVLGPQASPIIPDMAPCNVNADLNMAACITYELPGALLRLNYDERLSAGDRGPGRQLGTFA